MPSILFILSVIILLAGCLVLLLDVIVSLKTDHCQVAVAGEYMGRSATDEASADKPISFFVLAIPEFSYTYKGKKYRGKSANIFFHPILRKGKLAVPFIYGNTYKIFVNPDNPTMYITDGEQRITFIRILGIVLAVVGMGLVYFSMRMG